MRRARAKLQVSTFPFLAVLLGAMGSLIFLLLVMDRRAKLVARNKARDAIEARKQERAKKEADLLAARRKVEEERARDWDELERRLQDQERRLRTEAARLHADADKTAAALSAEERQALALRADAEQLRIGLALLAKEIQASRDEEKHEAEKDAAKREASRLALAKMTAELARMEKLVADLKERRGRAADVFSVVPYRGKHGENRKPIYIECCDRGMILQPEGKVLSLLEGTPERIRDEIRKAGLAMTPIAEPSRYDPPRLELPREKTGPYVLCLVRPDGLLAYNLLSRALAGFDVDFGYELVDAEWKLTFPTEMVVGIDEPTTTPRPRPGVVGVPASRTSGPADGGGTGAARSPGGTPGGVVGPEIGRVGTSLLPTLGPLATTPDKPGLGGTGKKDGGPPGGNLVRAPGIERPGGGASGSAATKEGKEGAAKDEADDASDIAWRGKKGDKAGKEGGRAEAPPDGATTPFGDPILAKTQGRPASLGHLLGSRDFIIHVACTETEAVVTLIGQRFPIDGSPAEQVRNGQALVDTVKHLIARRQAGLRPGEPPYRAMLRFQVYPGGLRSYYRVYPLLESLRLPMTRENIE